MKLEKMLTLMILLFSISLFSQTSTIVKVTHKPGKTLKDGVSVYDIPNWQPISSSSSNCFPFLSFRVFVKAKSKDELMYKVEVTNSSSYDLGVDCSRWGFGSGGRSTVRANSESYGSGSFTSSDFPTINFSKIKFTFTQEVQDNYGVSILSDYIQCGETATSYLNKKKKEKDDKAQASLEKQQQAERELEAQAELEKQEQAEREKQKQAEQEREAKAEMDRKEQTNNTSKEKADNEESENKGYQVLDVDTSAYEAEKARKRKLAEENRQQQAEQERRDREYKERKDAFEKEQLAKLDRSTQVYEQRQANLTNAGNTVLNAIDNMSRQADANRARQTAIYDAEARQRSAERAAKSERETIEFKKRKDAIEKKIRDREELEAKAERERLIDESQREFANSLEDQPIPLLVATDKVFFFMVDTFWDPSHIRFAPFKIFADVNKQIPYRKDIIDDFKLKTNEYGYKIYGPYNSRSDLENAMKNMAAQAERIQISRERDLSYTYVPEKKSKTNSETDFWGNKTNTKQKPTKKKKDNSFWDN
jgi:hypothetical protein